MKTAQQQYEWVRSSREIVFRFCEQIPPQQLAGPIASFGRGSVTDTLLHVADTYLYWIAAVGLQQQPAYSGPHTEKNMETIREAFDTVNAVVTEFLFTYAARPEAVITREATGNLSEIRSSPLQLFTHVITHEFHHKGQVMTMGRMLGHTPPDADIIR